MFGQQFYTLENFPHIEAIESWMSTNRSIADELIRLMGGELQSVVNEHHRGIKFDISLPACRPSQLRQESLSREETAVSAEQAEELPVRGPDSGVYTVLVVDDELLHLELMVNLLTREGYRVITARTGEEALGMIDLQASGPCAVSRGLVAASGHSVIVPRLCAAVEAFPYPNGSD